MLRRGIVSELGVFSATIFKKTNMETREVKMRPNLSPVSDAGLVNAIMVITTSKLKQRTCG